ncbi:acyl carrier protein [Candidatus Magnetomorum sp. HK-1]|nr:acyl carrier protein [Candidatus Magnetomorum sp. HK-1]
MSNEKKLFSIIAAVLEIDLNEINDDSSPDNITDWDSLKGLLMVTELEESFNVKFSMYEIMNVRNVKDIKDALSIRGVLF